MYGYKVKVEKRWWDQTVAIWFYCSNDGNITVLRRTKEGNWDREEVGRGELVAEPSLVLPADLFEQMIAAGSDFIPPSAATDRHLKDTIEVRDRLLTLVEKTPPA